MDFRVFNNLAYCEVDNKRLHLKCTHENAVSVLDLQELPWMTSYHARCFMTMKGEVWIVSSLIQPRVYLCSHCMSKLKDIMSHSQHFKCQHCRSLVTMAQMVALHLMFPTRSFGSSGICTGCLWTLYDDRVSVLCERCHSCYSKCHECQQVIPLLKNEYRDRTRLYPGYHHGYYKWQSVCWKCENDVLSTLFLCLQTTTHEDLVTYVIEVLMTVWRTPLLIKDYGETQTPINKL